MPYIDIINKIKKFFDNDLLYFSISLISLLGNLSYLCFCDEGDNLLGALILKNGGVVYKDFFSQHTPFAYYVSWVFSLLGAQTIPGFRLGIAVSFLLLCFLATKRYSKTIGKWPIRFVLILYPLTAKDFFSHMVMSDVFAAWAYLAIFLEWLYFYKNKKLDIWSYIIFSCSVFIAFMSAFLSLYALIAIFFIFFITLIILYRDEQIKTKSSDILILFLSICFPFILFFVYQYLIENINNFYEQAYVFNRIYYNKFIGGQLSSPIQYFESIISSLFISLITPFKDYKLFLYPIITLPFSLALILNNKKIFILTLVALSTICYRGCTGPHAVQIGLLGIFSIGCFFQMLQILNYNYIKYFKICFILILSLCIVGYSTYWRKGKIFNFGDRICQGTGENEILRLTKPNDYVWIDNLEVYTYINTQRMSAGKYSTIVPWLTDGYEDDIINNLKIKQPKIIMHYIDGTVWGYKNKDYAKKLFSYIEDNYCKIDPIYLEDKNLSNYIWINRRDEKYKCDINN